MIEQTEMVVTTWQYFPPIKPMTEETKILSYTDFDVMRKRAPTKKGIAFRFNCHFKMDGILLLEYVGETSYVIDFDEIIDRKELLKMIRYAFLQFNEKFDFRKLGTVLADKTLSPLNEGNIEIETILPMLM